MTSEKLQSLLVNTGLMDINFHSERTSENGCKISIQGKNTGDSGFLFFALSEFLYSNDIPFKLATVNRYALLNRNKEQSHKAMTIYCPDGMSFDNLCESVYFLTLEYKGWQDIKTPTSYSHYAGGLYVRNDRNKNGAYIPASNS
jgi:hypothetical protein